MQYDGAFAQQESVLRLMLPLHIGLYAVDAVPSGSVLARIPCGISLRAEPGVPLPALLGSPVEIWTTEADLHTHTEGRLIARYTDQAMMVTAPTLFSTEETFETDVTQLYEELLHTAHTLGFPHVLRMWNYVPHITAPSFGIDFYQRFNRARAAGFGPGSRPWPAATAVGTDREGLFVYMLASREPGIGVENPRQVSAFHYPEQYGPKSPLFARAVLKRWSPTLAHLYLSGTASVLGHASHHKGNVLAQVDEAIQNVAAVLERASEVAGRPVLLSDLAAIKVYVAQAADAPAVAERLAQSLPRSQLLLLRSDLCRQELLVELEAVAVITSPR